MIIFELTINNCFLLSLLVGAPRDHSENDIIRRRGAVWKCEFQSDDRCQRLPFRRDGKSYPKVSIRFNSYSIQAKRMCALAHHLIIKLING